MIFNVHMFALMGPGSVRQVEVPQTIVKDGSTDLINQAVLHLGQNGQQKSPGHVSVSAGDVIEWPFDGAPRYFLVELIGFSELTPDQFAGMSGYSEDAEPRHFGGFNLVNGMDPLSGMPSSMKVSTLVVLHSLLTESKSPTKYLLGEGLVNKEELAELRQFVSNAMVQLRLSRPKDKAS